MNTRRFTLLFLFVTFTILISRAQEQEPTTDALLPSVEKAQWSYVQQSFTNALSSTEKDRTPINKIGACFKRYGWVGKPHAFFAIGLLLLIIGDNLIDKLLGAKRYKKLQNEYDRVLPDGYEDFKTYVGYMVSPILIVFLVSQMTRFVRLFLEKLDGSTERRQAALKSVIVQWQAQLNKVPSLMQPLITTLYMRMRKNDLSAVQCDTIITGILAMTEAALSV